MSQSSAMHCLKKGEGKNAGEWAGMAETQRLVGWSGGCLIPQQLASVSQGRISLDNRTCCHTKTWVGVKNSDFTEKQKNIKQGSTKLKELHVCIIRVQKKMAAWRSEVP